MRCTMSWSVPWVASVTNNEPNSAAQTVYSVSNTLLIFPQAVSAGASPCHCQSARSCGPAEVVFGTLPAAGNVA